MLYRRHAENEALVPARVLNLVVIVDRDWKGEIANRLERVGRYQASRTVLCAVEEGRDDARRGRDRQLRGARRRKSRGRPRARRDRSRPRAPRARSRRSSTRCWSAEMPTIVWAPHGHDQRDHQATATDRRDPARLRRPFGPGGRVRPRRRAPLPRLLVDLAWLRTTPVARAPGRELRSAPPPRRTPAHRQELEVRHRDHSAASGLLLTGWLASRLHWECEPLVERSGRAAVAATARRRGRRGGVANAHLRPGGARPRRRHRLLRAAGPRSRSSAAKAVSTPRSGSRRAAAGLEDPRRLAWRGRDPRRGGRQALLRDPTYDPGARSGPGALSGMTLSLEVVEDPATRRRRDDGQRRARRRRDRARRADRPRRPPTRSSSARSGRSGST